MADKKFTREQRDAIMNQLLSGVAARLVAAERGVEVETIYNVRKYRTRQEKVKAQETAQRPPRTPSPLLRPIPGSSIAPPSLARLMAGR